MHACTVLMASAGDAMISGIFDGRALELTGSDAFKAKPPSQRAGNAREREGSHFVERVLI